MRCSTDPATRRRRWGGASAGLCAALLVFWHSTRTHPREPVYDGKILSAWLYPGEADFQWIPNDLYGHIHDELWADLVQPAPAAEVPMPQFPPDPGQPHLDTNAIPWLVRWMGIQPSGMDRLRRRVAGHLPARLESMLGIHAESVWGEPEQRWHIASMRGFELLKTNSIPAVAALSNLLNRSQAELPFTTALAVMGRPGVAVLTNALRGTNDELRDSAALALGLTHAEREMAVPALLDCVERGKASYHVLGALGRIHCEDPRLVLALVTELERTNATPGVILDETMAILVLGLQGPRARAAVPVLQAVYWRSAVRGDANSRKLVRRVLKSITGTDDQLPAALPGEDNTEWP